MLAEETTHSGGCSRFVVHYSLHRQSPKKPSEGPCGDQGRNSPKHLPIMIDHGRDYDTKGHKAPCQTATNNHAVPNPRNVTCGLDRFIQGGLNPLPLVLEPVGSSFADRKVPQWKCDNQDKQRPYVPEARYNLAASGADVAEPVTEGKLFTPQPPQVQNATFRTRNVRTIRQRFVALPANEHHIGDPMAEQEFVDTERRIQKPVDHEGMLPVPSLEVLPAAFRAGWPALCVIFSCHEGHCTSLPGSTQAKATWKVT